MPRRATINAPPPMGPLGGLTGDPGASFSTYPKGGTIPKGGFLISALSYGGGMGQLLEVLIFWSTPCERLSTRVRKFSRILQPTATLVQDSATSAERAPLFDKAVFRKATCTPVGSHFQKLRHAQVLFFCTVSVFLYCFSRSCEIFTDSCNERNIDLSRLAYTKNTCML